MRKFLATILAVMTLFCSTTVPAQAAMPGDNDEIISPQSSNYLSSYNCYSLKGSASGEMDIDFLVVASIPASKVGIEKIELYKDTGRHIATIYGSTSNGMQAENISAHGGTYTYKGIPGNTYYAKVTVFASDSKGSDSRVIITNSITV